jgi:hypothetical protein
MNRLPFLLAALLFAIACGEDDDDDDGGNTSPSSAGDSSGANTTAPSTTTSTTSTEETCMSNHVCVNGACTCQTPGLEDQPCTDDMACEDECEVCM